MMQSRRAFLLEVGAAALSVSCAPARSPATPVRPTTVAPIASIPLHDHHTHLFSPAVSAHVSRELTIEPPLAAFPAAALRKVLEDDHVANAAVLSNAYLFSRPGMNTADQTAEVQHENDWVAREVASAPRQLIAFFSVNPLADHAAAEIARCAGMRTFAGLKLHLANSQVELRTPAHVAALRRVFVQVGALGLPVVVHLRTMRPDFGRTDAEIFLREVVAAAPDVVVQIAHAGGWGGYDPETDQSLGAFADALRGPLRRRLWLDLSAVVRGVGKDAAASPRDGWWPARRYERLRGRMRQIGMERFVFGTDWPDWSPASYRADLERSLGLEPAELAAVLANRAPWLAGK